MALPLSASAAWAGQNQQYADSGISFDKQKVMLAFNNINNEPFSGEQIRKMTCAIDEDPHRRNTRPTYAPAGRAGISPAGRQAMSGFLPLQHSSRAARCARMAGEAYIAPIEHCRREKSHESIYAWRRNRHQPQHARLFQIRKVL